MSISPTTQNELALDLTEYALEQIVGGKSSVLSVVSYLIQIGMSHGYNEAQAGKTSVDFTGFRAKDQKELTQWGRVHMVESIAQGKRTLYQAVYDIIARAADYRLGTRILEIEATRLLNIASESHG